MLDSIQFTNWMNRNNCQWHCPRTGISICTHAETHALYCSVMSELRGRSMGTSALCNAVSNSESHGYKWDIEPTSGWNDFPCEIWTECTTHSDSCVIETKCCFYWCGAPRGAVASPGSNGSPACNLVFLCSHGHHLLFLNPSIHGPTSRMLDPAVSAQENDAAPRFLSYCWSGGWVWSSSLKPS